MNEIIERIKKHHPQFADSTIGVRALSVKAESVNPDTRLLWVVANTDDIDSDNEVVVPAGADPTYFQTNKAMFVDHRYSFDNAVATARSWRKVYTGARHNAWKVQAYVLPLANNRLGDDLLTFAREATIGVSIGFEPLDWGKPTEAEATMYAKGSQVPESIVRRWKWVELSFTAFPCNVSCRSQAVQTIETNAAAIDRLLTKGLVAKSSAEALGYRVKPMKIKAVCQLGS